MLKHLSVVAIGGPRNRQGQVVSYEFTSEFQELWFLHTPWDSTKRRDAERRKDRRDRVLAKAPGYHGAPRPHPTWRHRLLPTPVLPAERAGNPTTTVGYASFHVPVLQRQRLAAFKGSSAFPCVQNEPTALIWPG